MYFFNILNVFVTTKSSTMYMHILRILSVLFLLTALLCVQLKLSPLVIELKNSDLSTPKWWHALSIHSLPIWPGQ